SLPAILLPTTSNPRQQATINDGRVTVQPVQGRQISYAAGTTRTFTPGASGSHSGKQRIVTYYNCKGEGHMSKQCIKPRMKRDGSWFKDKVLQNVVTSFYFFKALFQDVHIFPRHETSTARTPEQNGVVERRNRTLVEAARTMLSATKVPLFFWAEAIATTCFTQNRSLVIPRHEKTPYHIINARKPSVKFFHIFGFSCYNTISENGENLDKMKKKVRLYLLVSTAVNSDPGPQCSTMVLEQDNLCPGPQSLENVPQVAKTVTTSNELELIYSPMFSELLNGTSHVVSKSSAVHAAD
ncbi:retrovirus-related pol polyprotein from transposon TNT 1-94, partial [Tanacetum coccineum]